MDMNEVSDLTNVEALSASSPALVLPPDAGLALVAERLVAQAAADGVALTGKGGLLTDLGDAVGIALNLNADKSGVDTGRALSLTIARSKQTMHPNTAESSFALLKKTWGR